MIAQYIEDKSWWAGPDLNRRPLARKANVLTKLDDRPPELAYFVRFWLLSFAVYSCFIFFAVTYEFKACLDHSPYNFINSMLPPLNDDEDNSEPIDPIDKWEVEQWRKRGTTIPSPEVEKYNSTEKPVEQQNEPEQPSEPLDPQQYIDQTFQRKQKQIFFEITV